MLKIHKEIFLTRPYKTYISLICYVSKSMCLSEYYALALSATACVRDLDMINLVKLDYGVSLGLRIKTVFATAPSARNILFTQKQSRVI